MARCRSIKPGFMTNEHLPELGMAAHLLYPMLWMIADKDGRLEDRPKRIKGECMPHYDVDVDDLLDRLASGEDPFIRRYTVQRKKYIQIIKWKENQSPHHTEKTSVIPEPPLDNGEVTVSSPPSASVHTTSNQLPVISNQQPETRDQSVKTTSRKFTPPTVDAVAAYCRERNNDVDPEQFVDFYTGKGWKIGKNPMVDWKATVRTWEKSDRTRAGPADDPRNVKASINEFLARGKKSGQP